MSISKVIPCKRFPVFLLLFIASFYTHAQKTDSLWFDKNWKVTQTPEERFYLRTIKPVDSLFEVMDYYPNGKAQMTGYFTSLKPENRNGEFSYYSESGVLTSKNIWVNNMVAETFTFDETGKQTLHIIKKEYLATLSTQEKLEKYGIKEITKQPEFPGGNNRLSEFLSKTIIYPPQAMQGEIQGRVIVAVSIDEKGNLKHIRVAQKAHPLLDEEALRIANLLPKKKWTPAQNNQENITADFIFPINFKL
ncbi:energy transducer TonB [Rufibacter psychrotolerans]|uniref:energy transducer TonB n=1 Tax=Rufibacter psychrotolerans TaxID=2812556 RepID=UPI001967EDE1|nr:energy transducer TonB [Rufibacter sp. SYSU D00308]